MNSYRNLPMFGALKPLFSPYRDHVGWIDPGRYIFDTEMAYIAFIAAGSAWSGRSGAWLGPVVDTVTILDTDGRPVAWSNDVVPRGIGQPMRPVSTVRAVAPPRPVRPVYPKRPLAAPYCAGGWSAWSFVEWVAFGDPPPPVEEEIEQAEVASDADVGAEPATPAETAEIIVTIEEAPASPDRE